jgi:hypothetical protein
MLKASLGLNGRLYEIFEHLVIADEIKSNSAYNSRRSKSRKASLSEYSRDDLAGRALVKLR